MRYSLNSFYKELKRYQKNNRIDQENRRVIRKKLIYQIFYVIFGIGGAIGCTPSHKVLSVDRSQTTTPSSERLRDLLQEPEGIHFSHVQDLVLNSHCISCHNTLGSKGNVELTTYESLFSGSGFQRVVVPFDTESSPLFNTLISSGSRHMPPIGEPQLSEEQKNLIYVWISHGAKYSSSSVISRGPLLKEILQPYFDQPETIDYTVVNEQVFNNYCFKCHSQHSKWADEDVLIYSADLTSYETIFSSFEPAVIKGRPEESLIYSSTAIEQTMPPFREGYDPLNSFLVKLIRLWILNCAIETYSPGEIGLISNPKTPEKVRLCEGQ